MTAVLKAASLSKAYDSEPLFRNAEFTITPGDRVALVGPNGVGKSTLLALLAGQEPPTSGRVDLSPGASLGYFTQQVPDPNALVGEFLAEGLGEIHLLEREMTALADAAAAGSAAALAAYGDAQDRWTALRGWLAAPRLAEVRERLGITHLADDAPLAAVSGGEQARLTLGRLLLGQLLLRRPGVLLLDEPTNHLDASGVDWLAGYLAAFPGGVLMVTHDRAFMNRVATRVFELDGVSDEIQVYEGGYTAYRVEKQRRWSTLLLDYEAQEKHRRRLAASIEATMAHALRLERTTSDSTARRVAKKAKSRERRLQREMDSIRWLAEPRTPPRLTLAFPADDTSGAEILAGADLTVEFDGRRLLDGVSVTVRAGDRILVTGDNGAGKTTLLRVLSGTLAPHKGTVGSAPGTAVAVLPQTHDLLRSDETVFGYFRSQVPVYAEDAEELLTAHMFGPGEWPARLRDLSAGELRRLLLAVVVNSPARVLMLDEPTNFLDFDALDVVEEALRAFRGTLVMVTHDSYFAERVGWSRRWVVGGGGVRETGAGTASEPIAGLSRS